MTTVRCGDYPEIVAPFWKHMEPPDRKGQHVRHCKTHRNAFVQELGPQKMLVYCPDKNLIEHRWTTAFYKVPASHISVAVDVQNQLRVTTEVNMEDGGGRTRLYMVRILEDGRLRRPYFMAIEERR